MENTYQDYKEICRFCLIKCENFQIMKGNTKDDLDMLLPEINLAVSEESLMCINCADTIKKCVDFKTTCLDTHDYIVSLINNDNDAKINLKVVYLSKNENVIDIPEDHNVCGFCMGLVKRCFAISLHNEDGDNMHQKMFEKCLPEVDLNIINEPIICAPCHGSLENYFRFFTNCLIVEKKIKKYGENLNIAHDKDLTELSNVLQFPLINILTRKEDDNIVGIIKEEKFCVDDENVDQLVGVKVESFVETEHHQRFNSVQVTSKNVSICEEDKKTDVIKTEGNFYTQPANEVVQRKGNFVEMEDQQFLHNEDIDIKTDQHDFNRYEDGIVLGKSEVMRLHIREKFSMLNLAKDQSNQYIENSMEVIMYKCDSCSFLTKYKEGFKRHMILHKNPSEVTMYKCDSCSYETKFKYYLKRHKTLHKNPSEVTMYKCYACSYQTKFKYYLKKHLLLHKNPSEVKMYKCDSCSFQTKYRYCFRRHMLKHKDPSEVTIYKCDSCSFETKCKFYIKSHLLKHKDPSVVTMYKCDYCLYQTKRKCDLTKHSLKHKNPPKITMYKSEACSLQAKRRRDLGKDLLTPKDPSEVAMYKCDSCLYQSKLKSGLKNHTILHKNSLEITMCTSDPCSFQSKHKKRLKVHSLNHKDLSETTLHKCEYCSFQTKDKGHLKRHLLTHKVTSEITMYKCDHCLFQTKYKRNLKGHMLTHKDPSKVTMYKCDHCSFQTKRISTLRVHLQTHKNT